MKPIRDSDGDVYVEFADADGVECHVAQFAAEEFIRLACGDEGIMVLSRLLAAELWPLLKQFAESGRLEGDRP
jgi:hypothetical protein